MRVVIICGSPRARSYTRVLSATIWRQALAEGHEADLLDLGEAPLDPFRGHEVVYSCETRRAVAVVEAGDCLIICTPTYNSSMSSCLKNLFEHLPPKALEAKVVGVAVMAAGCLAHIAVFGQILSICAYFRALCNPEPVFSSWQDFDGLELVDPQTTCRLGRLFKTTCGLALALRTRAESVPPSGVMP